MAIWSMLEPREAGGTLHSLERTIAVRDGWSWGAFWLGPLWLLWRRMWLVFLAWLAVVVLFSVAADLLKVPDALTGWLFILATIWFALEANALRRWTLLRRGWRFAGFAAGRSLVEAEQRFFAEVRGAPEPLAPRPAAGTLRGVHSGEVIGMFPDPVANGPGYAR